ncbi:hypothetical protein C8J57DRAFT_1482693 [Mycena rebaudengoi]|nr:hypothetical protein C8J57DRAFT_1482693 [Mycena rebaudengoi]
MSDPMTTKNLPDELRSFKDLYTYLKSSKPIALSEAIFEVDFHEPVTHQYTPDFSAYTNDDDSIFIPSYSVRSRASQLQCGAEAGPDLQASFTKQLNAVAAAVMRDDNLDKDSHMQVVLCTDTSRVSATGGTYLEMRVRNVEVAPKAGDWIIAVASIHRHTVHVNDIREYRVVSKKVRVIDPHTVTSYSSDFTLGSASPEPESELKESSTKTQDCKHDGYALGRAPPNSTVRVRKGGRSTEPKVAGSSTLALATARRLWAAPTAQYMIVT